MKRYVFLILSVTCFFLVTAGLVSWSQTKKCDEAGCQGEAVFPDAASWHYFVFTGPGDSEIIPYTAGEAVDLKIGTRDCCILDDIVEIYVDDCLIGTHNSGSGQQTAYHWISLKAGEHVIKLLNTSSDISASGWYYQLDPQTYTGNYPSPCGCASPSGTPVKKFIGSPDSCNPQNPSSTCKVQLNFDGDFRKDCLLNEIESDAGEKLQLWCIKAGWYFLDNASAYKLYYFNPEGEHHAIGFCAFNGGMNEGYVFHSGDTDPANGKPDCFISTRWVSMDQQRGDSDDDGDGKIDWWEFTYDVNGDNLAKIHYESVDGPGGTDPDSVEEQDPPLGPETDAFFVQLHEELQNLPNLEDIPMGMSPFEPCDLDRDGDCDDNDRGIFQNCLGSQRGDSNYNTYADIDGDGVITSIDETLLFPIIQIDIKPGSEPNSINVKSRGVVPVAILTNSQFDASTVDPLSLRFGNGGACPIHKNGHLEDVDNDGDIDFVFHFKTQDIGIYCGDTRIPLAGVTFEGIIFEASDRIKTVGCK